jgi:hypothetical protein
VTIPATVPQGSEIPEGLTNNPVYLLHNYFVVINVSAMCSILRLIFINPLSRKEWKVYKIPLFNFVLSNTEISTDNKRRVSANVGFKTKEELQP